MSQVMRAKLKLVNVHLEQLVNTVKEKDEVGRIILAVINVGPCLHLKSRCLQVWCHHLSV